MDQKLKISIAVSLFLLVVAVFWFVYEYSKAHEPSLTFSVTAEGKEVVVPNIAELRIGIITEGGMNLKDLQDENTTKANRVINFLKEQNIDPKDIQTVNYSIYPKYDYHKVPYQIVGYTVEHTLRVKIRDLEKLSKILEGVVKLGANRIDGPDFTVDDSEVYLEKAREKAIKSAKEKAQKIAELTGFKLGRIISISESLESPTFPLYYLKATEMGAGGGPEIESGSKEIKVRVSITYEIK